MSALAEMEIFIPLEGVIDLSAQILRLEKDLKKTSKEWEKYNKKLNNPKFLNKAPDEIIAEVKFNEAEFRNKMETIKENLDRFKA